MNNTITKTRIDIRLSEKEKKMAQEQADKLGLNLSEYLRMVINLDTSTEIISIIKGKAERVNKLIESIRYKREDFGYDAYNDEGKRCLEKVASVIDRMDEYYSIEEIKALLTVIDEFGKGYLYIYKMLNKKLNMMENSKERGNR